MTMGKLNKLVSSESGFVVLQLMNNPFTPLSEMIHGYLPTYTALLLAVWSRPETLKNNFGLPSCKL